MPTLPPHPDLSLSLILLYAFFAFVFVLALTPWFVSFLRKHKIGKQLRAEAMDGGDASVFRQLHQSKNGTPTMGGILIWVGVLATVLLSRVFSYGGVVDYSLLQRGQVYLPLFTLVSLGILGAIDDYLNIVGASETQFKKIYRPMRLFFWLVTIGIVAYAVYGFSIGQKPLDMLLLAMSPNSYLPPWGVFVYSIFSLFYLGSCTAVLDHWSKRKSNGVNKRGGLSVLPKFLSLLIIGLMGAIWFYTKLGYDSVDIPYYGLVTVGWWYIPIFIFIMVGTANAVNFTDGLDGLAGGLLVLAFGGFGVLAYAEGLTLLAAFCGVCVGAIAAFLWHNVPPAIFFMGDTGALALGGALGVIALMTDHVLVLPLIGFIFVIETLSVIIQLTSKRLRGGKKIFRSAPIHHHFEALGWGESKVTMRFWIVGFFMAFLGIIVGLAG